MKKSLDEVADEIAEEIADKIIDKLWAKLHNTISPNPDPYWRNGTITTSGKFYGSDSRSGNF